MKAYLAALLLACGAGCDSPPTATKPEKTSHPLVGTMRSATLVTAHRVDRVATSNGSVSFHARPVGVSLSPTDQGRLAGAVESINFEPGRSSRCMFAPGLEYRFSGAGKRYVLKLCFDCGEVKFVDDADVGLSRTVSFGAAKIELLKIAKTLFPNDEEIQDLR